MKKLNGFNFFQKISIERIVQFKSKDLNILTIVSYNREIMPNILKGLQKLQLSFAFLRWFSFVSKILLLARKLNKHCQWQRYQIEEQSRKVATFLLCQWIVYVPIAKKIQMDIKEHHKKQVLKRNNYQYIST